MGGIRSSFSLISPEPCYTSPLVALAESPGPFPHLLGTVSPCFCYQPSQDAAPWETSHEPTALTSPPHYVNAQVHPYMYDSSGVRDVSLRHQPVEAPLGWTGAVCHQALIRLKTDSAPRGVHMAAAADPEDTAECRPAGLDEHSGDVPQQKKKEKLDRSMDEKMAQNLYHQTPTGCIEERGEFEEVSWGPLTDVPSYQVVIRRQLSPKSKDKRPHI
ncbi:unnamed protein product [Pleuronectes platessa]|uniref:Uncharacterized protein n=1 Tax=Pleuronectes platessa TaxID=8262 RepID=A0A9N7VSI8_PLEPL|nr:unnamed protein product [Pleuronectes platessa]